MTKAVAVFLAMAVTDFLWGRYILATSAGRTMPAAAFSMAIVGVGAVVTLAYVSQPWYIIPAMLGAGTGTVLAVRRG